MKNGDPGLYKVPKEKALVLVKVPPTPPEWKTVFISSCAETHRGQETVSDLFNAPRKFFPLLDEREGIILVRRNAIRWVRIENPEKSEWYYYEVRQGAPRSIVRCSFDDGEVLEGTLYAIGPAGEQRVQDHRHSLEPGSRDVAETALADLLEKAGGVAQRIRNHGCGSADRQAGQEGVLAGDP